MNPDKKQSNVNLNKNIENQIDIYINCGRLLAASCRYFNVPYAIVTNELDFVRDRVAFCGGGVDVVPENLIELFRPMQHSIPLISSLICCGLLVQVALVTLLV